MGTSFTFYISKDRPNLIKLCRDLLSRGELSDFIIEVIETHDIDALQNRLRYHTDQKKHWAKILKDVKERVVKEQLRRETELKEQIKIVEQYLKNMIDQTSRPGYSPAYTHLARYIEEDCGLKLTVRQISDFYKRKLKGEEINLLEELLECER